MSCGVNTDTSLVSGSLSFPPYAKYVAMMQTCQRSGEFGQDPTADFRQRPFSVTADGCQKVNHYANCGRTMTEAVQPRLQKYFGSCNTAAMHCPVRGASQEEHSICGANLACAREVANKSGGVTDIKCLITCTCLHTIPCKGCFIAARTNEQFFFYDLLLARLMPDRMPAALVDQANGSSGHIPFLSCLFIVQSLLANLLPYLHALGSLVWALL